MALFYLIGSCLKKKSALVGIGEHAAWPQLGRDYHACL